MSETTRPEKKIAIFGTTPSRMEGPHQDGSGWERWTIGPGGKDAHNWERLYEIHGIWPEDFKEYLEELKKIEPPREVWFLPNAPIEDFPAKRVLPKEYLLQKFGRRMWFSSSISWLIVHAIEEGATDIGLWGIDLESGEEYISQFAGCAHFLDLARLIGINIHLPKACGLMRDPAPYPDRYETNLALMMEKKSIWLSNTIGGLEPEFDNLKADTHRKEGELMTLQRLGGDAKEIEELQRVLMHQQVRIGQLAANINTLKGEHGATQFYRKMYVWGMNDP